jgi:hypothetical protein
MKRTLEDWLSDLVFLLGLIGLLAILVIISGCAEQPLQRVEIPVEVPCQVALPAEPKWPLSDPALKAKSQQEKAAAVFEELELRIAYESKLQAVVKRCISSPTP